MNVAEALRLGAARLQAAGVDNPRSEARLLLAHAMGCEPADLIRAPDAEAPDYDALLVRRLAHEPMAYIVGHRGFWDLDFAVSPATLIPRPDTETLIEAALALSASCSGLTRASVRSPARAKTDARVKPEHDAERAGEGRILDLGTGTGCILLTLLHAFPAAFGVGTDRSLQAAALARQNAASLGLADRVAFITGDWANAITGPFDLIISNPPYIPSAEIAGLMPDVAAYEPQSALDGGPDGLAAYRRIVADLPRLLTPGGTAIFELGIGQAESVTAIAAKAGLTAQIRLDLAGIARAIVLRRAN